MVFIRNNLLLIGATVIISFMLTFYAVSVDPIINPDAIIYLSAAEEISSGNFANAFELYKWPFYSIAIAAFESTLGVSSQNAAFILNALMQALSIIGFLACVHALGGSKRTIIIAAVLILLFPSFNKYRSFIIRDAGFLAFYFWSLYHLFLAVQFDQIKRYIYAFILMFMAMLFRIEAVAILAIVPAYLMYSNSNSRRSRFVWLSLTIIGSAILFLGISIWLFGEQSKVNGNGIFSLLLSSMEQLQTSLQFKLHVIREQLLNEFSLRVAPAVLIISVACITIYETLRRLAYIFAFFSWHAIKNQLVLENAKLKNIFFLLCAIQVVLLFLFALINMFLVSRHTMALTLTILLLTPFSLEYFFHRWQNRFTIPLGSLKVTIPFFTVVLILLAIDGIDLKTNKLEMIEAGQWLSEITQENTGIYSNQPLLLHYAGEKPAHYNLKFNWKELDHLLVTKRIFDFDYVAIMIHDKFNVTRKYLSEHLHTKPSVEKFFGEDNLVLVFDLRKFKSKNELFDQRYLKIMH